MKSKHLTSKISQLELDVNALHECNKQLVDKLNKLCAYIKGKDDLKDDYLLEMECCELGVAKVELQDDVQQFVNQFQPAVQHQHQHPQQYQNQLSAKQLRKRKQHQVQGGMYAVQPLQMFSQRKKIPLKVQARFNVAPVSSIKKTARRFRK